MNHTATASRFCSTRGRWSALNIVLMIIGFAVFWPLGLAMLAWIIWGDEIGRRTGELKDQVRSFSERASTFRPGEAWRSDSGNVAFEEYRQRELKRIEEERRKLDAMREEFETFVREVRRAKDQEEFDRFMQNYGNRPAAGDSAGETAA
jgi:Protein of unknown function (DUF2852)